MFILYIEAIKNKNKGDGTMIKPLLKHIDNWRAMRVRHMSRYWQATADIPPACTRTGNIPRNSNSKASHEMPFFSPAPSRGC